MKKLLLLLVIAIYGVQMSNAQNKKSDFFVSDNIHQYTVEIAISASAVSEKQIGTIYNLTPEDAEELIRIFKGYQWEIADGLEVMQVDDYFYYNTYYPIRITNPAGEIRVFWFQTDFPGAKSYSDIEPVFAKGQYFEREHIQLIKNYFRKYVTHFSHIALIDGEMIQITLPPPYNPYGIILETSSKEEELPNIYPVRLSLEETHRYIELYNTGWDISCRTGGFGDVVSDERKYVLTYGGQELFRHSYSHHEQYGFEFEKEVEHEMNEIIEKAIIRAQCF